MFEYLLVIASTFIYFKVFSYPEENKEDKGTQTDPWYPLQVLDLMEISSDCSLPGKTQCVDWFPSSDTDSSELELPPLMR